jgi:hypothetical protein
MLGVDPEYRANSLTDEEILTLSNEIDLLPAGSDFSRWLYWSSNINIRCTTHYRLTGLY